MTNNVLAAGIIVSVSVIELNCNKCCSSCNGDKKNPEPEVKPFDFKSIKIQKCTITDTGETLNCEDITKTALSMEYKFENVIDDETVYGDSAMVFRIGNRNNFLLVFTKDIKFKIKDNEILSKVCEISEGVYFLYSYMSGEDKYGVISKYIQDDKDENIFTIVECGKGI